MSHSTCVQYACVRPCRPCPRGTHQHQASRAGARPLLSAEVASTDGGGAGADIASTGDADSDQKDSASFWSSAVTRAPKDAKAFATWYLFEYTSVETRRDKLNATH